MRSLSDLLFLSTCAAPQDLAAAAAAIYIYLYNFIIYLLLIAKRPRFEAKQTNEHLISHLPDDPAEGDGSGHSKRNSILQLPLRKSDSSRLSFGMATENKVIQISIHYSCNHLC